MDNMTNNFGEVDLYQLLKNAEGNIKIQLIDAGMVRDKQQAYEFGAEPDNENLIWIRPKASRTAKKITIPAKIQITPKLLIFFGMYDGDGNKTGNIGFAQNNTELQTFVGEGIEEIFPDAFVAKVNILESSKFFELEEIKAEVSKIAQRINDESGMTVTLLEAQKVYLQEEFYKMDFHIGKKAEMSVTISPKKGGETKGKRSYEIIVEKKDSRYFLTLLLFIIKETINSVLGIKSVSAIKWAVNPQTGYRSYVDVEKFIQSDRCKYPGSRGSSTYSIIDNAEYYIDVSKRGQKKSIRLLKKIYITPLLCVLFGIYWAEGTTTKKKLFSFRNEKEEGINIGFNSSEDKSLQLFFNTMFKIFKDPDDLISCWLVKIGAKYHAESNAIGSKLGVPVTRGGPGGDGIARTVEITKTACDWALQQFPTMKDWAKYYSHVEFTGAGIPRIDIRCKPTGALFFFSVMVDITFYENDIHPYLVYEKA